MFIGNLIYFKKNNLVINVILKFSKYQNKGYNIFYSFYISSFVDFINVIRPKLAYFRTSSRSMIIFYL